MYVHLLQSQHYNVINIHCSFRCCKTALFMVNNRGRQGCTFFCIKGKAYLFVILNQLFTLPRVYCVQYFGRKSLLSLAKVVLISTSIVFSCLMMFLVFLGVFSWSYFNVHFKPAYNAEPGLCFSILEAEGQCIVLRYLFFS